MIKKIALIVLLICLSLGLFSPGLVRADGELVVTNSSAEMDFPMRLIFNVSAESDVMITDIRLCYVVNRMEHVNIFSEIYVLFVPSTSVTAQWVMDMRKTGGLPPGSDVDYWWQVTDAGGKEVRTTPARIEIDDNRYNWRQITEGDVTIFWYKGDNSFASELMEATQSALSRLAENTGAELENPIRFYIYANSSDLRGAMIYPQEWTGGVAYVRYGVIAIGISPDSHDIEWGKRVISHELTHLVVHQVTFNPYSDLPTWLDEGLAMTSEGELTLSFTNALAEAWNQNSLISVRSLASPFSAYADESLLAYAESYRLVEYLIDNYGRDKMFRLLNTFKEGSGYDEALEKVYGFDMDGLNTLWRASLETVAVP
ncbi:MAG: peptidase MA domain-containing protein [Dehalococcoidales bacterium]|nr:peptidase MA domain-containing protein [Dehalococcoidales bacterium]